MNQPEQSKWSKTQVSWFFALVAFLFFVLPLLIFYYMFHGFLDIN